MKFLVTAACALGAVSASQTAHAALNEGRFTAQVTWASATTGLAEVGSTINGSFTFDDAGPKLPDSIYCPAERCASYSFKNPYSFAVTLGDTRWESDEVFINISQFASTGDPSRPLRSRFSLVEESGPYDMILDLWGDPYAVGSPFPSSLTNLNDFQGMGRFNVTIQPVSGHVFATVTSFTVSPIPEPSTVALFGCGLLGLAFHARRRVPAALKTARVSSC